MEDRCGKGGCEEEVNSWFRLREEIADIRNEHPV